MASIPVVTPIEGEVMRLLVRSRTTPGLRYLVDLESYDLNGECGCDHFAFKLRQELEQSPRPRPMDRTRCWHILQARRWILDKFLAKLAEQCGQARMPRLSCVPRHE
jgi:hypothetical protein